MIALKKYILPGFILTICVSLLVGAGFARPAQAGLPVSEAGLRADGAPYEINPDEAGNLWVTEYFKGEIWRIDPATGDYTAYVVGNRPADARHVGKWLWWADAETNLVGRVTIDTGDYEEWQVPNSTGFYSTYVDNQERLYAAEYDTQYLYRLDPVETANNLCYFILPQSPPPLQINWKNRYMAGAGDYLWIVDWEGQLLRLKISDNTYHVWTLTTVSDKRNPFGIALDNQGNVWYTDQFSHAIGKLDPITNQVTSYAIPEGGGINPGMLALQSGYAWYTDYYLPGISRLDPLAAGSVTFSPIHAPETLTPTCSTIPVLATGIITVNQGQLSWSANGYPALIDSAGWRVYQMPIGSAPWGIAVTDAGYVVDSGRNVLGKFPLITSDFFLPLIRR